MDPAKEAIDVFQSQIRIMVNNREGVLSCPGQIVTMAHEVHKRMGHMRYATDPEAQAKYVRLLRDAHSKLAAQMESIGKLLDEVEPHLPKAPAAVAVPISAVQQAIAAAAAAPAPAPFSPLTTSAFLRSRKPLTVKTPHRTHDTAVASTAQSPRSTVSLKRPALRPHSTNPRSSAASVVTLAQSSTTMPNATPRHSSPPGAKRSKITDGDKENVATPQGKPQEKKNYRTLDGWMMKTVKKEVEEKDDNVTQIEVPVVEASEARSMEVKRSRSSGRTKFELGKSRYIKQEVEETQTASPQVGEGQTSSRRSRRVKTELDETAIYNSDVAPAASAQPPSLHGRGRASKWECAVCGEVYTNHSAIYSHMLNEHEGEIVAKCEGCGLLDSFAKLIVHRKEGQKSCGRRTALLYWFKKENEKPEEEMNEEEKEEKKQRGITRQLVIELRKCMHDGCEELLQERHSFRELNAHYREIHSCSVYYRCPNGECDKTFTEPLQFVKHRGQKCSQLIPDMTGRYFKKDKAVVVVKKEKRW